LVLLPLTLFLLAASFGVYHWWTTWPAREVVRVPGRGFPLAFSPDGKLLAIWASDGATFWDLEKRQPRSHFTSKSGGDVASGKFSPDGRTFAARIFHRSRNPIGVSICLVDVGTGKERPVIDPKELLLELAFRPDGRTLRTLLDTGDLVDFDLAYGSEVARLRLSCPFSFQSRHAMSADGALLAAAPISHGTFEGEVVFWDLDRDCERFRLPFGQPARADTGIWDLVFSQDSTLLAVGYNDGSIDVWDLSTRKVRQTFHPHRGGYDPTLLTFAPNNATLASFAQYLRRSRAFNDLRAYVGMLMRDRNWGPPPELVLLDVRSGRRLGRTMWEGCPVFSADSRTIATSHVDQGIRLRDVPSTR
jgi:WD40 repeat protein